jgi:hypothetical protein
VRNPFAPSEPPLEISATWHLTMRRDVLTSLRTIIVSSGLDTMVTDHKNSITDDGPARPFVSVPGLIQPTKFGYSSGSLSVLKEEDAHKIAFRSCQWLHVSRYCCLPPLRCKLVCKRAYRHHERCRHASRHHERYEHTCRGHHDEGCKQASRHHERSL